MRLSSPLIDKTDLEGFSQELRLSSNDSDATFRWLVGAFYQDQDLGQTQQSFLRGFKRWWDTATGLPQFVTGDRDFDYSRDENFKDRAVFGELTWHFTDQFQMTGGLRYYNNDFTNRSFMDLPLFTGVFTPENSCGLASANAATNPGMSRGLVTRTACMPWVSV